MPSRAGRQEQIDVLPTRFFPPREPHEPDEETGPVPDGLSYEEVARRAISAVNAEKLARLWMGGRSNYASDSGAGLAGRSTEVTR